MLDRINALINLNDCKLEFFQLQITINDGSSRCLCLSLSIKVKKKIYRTVLIFSPTTHFGEP